jgi:hypothetical protein
MYRIDPGDTALTTRRGLRKITPHSLAVKLRTKKSVGGQRDAQIAKNDECAAPSRLRLLNTVWAVRTPSVHCSFHGLHAA